MANRRVTIRKESRERFLDELRRHGNVSQAAATINRARQTMYLYRQNHPDFAAAWDHAVEEFLDRLETEAARRAAIGVTRPVFQGGKQVGTITEYSDRLLEFLLDRKRYPARTKHEHTGANGAPIEVREIRDVVVDPARDGQAGG
jgi:hypothetical protein